MQVDRQGSISSSLLFTCYGLPAKSTQMQLVRGRYRPVAGLCQGRQIRVAFNNEAQVFMVNTEENNKWEYNYNMREYPVSWSVQNAASGQGSYPYVILSTFFAAHQLSPIWMDNYWNWGYYDTEAGLWTGAVAMVRTDIIKHCYLAYFLLFCYCFVTNIHTLLIFIVSVPRLAMMKLTWE